MCAQLVMHQAGFDPNALANDQQTSLFELLCRCGDVAWVSRALELGACVERWGGRALFAAVESRSVPTLRLLLGLMGAAKAHGEAALVRGAGGRTLIHHAVRCLSLPADAAMFAELARSALGLGGDEPAAASAVDDGECGSVDVGVPLAPSIALEPPSRPRRRWPLRRQCGAGGGPPAERHVGGAIWRRRA